MDATHIIKMIKNQCIKKYILYLLNNKNIL